MNARSGITITRLGSPAIICFPETLLKSSFGIACSGRQVVSGSVSVPVCHFFRVWPRTDGIVAMRSDDNGIMKCETL